jgi:hypothetical protein
MEDERGGEMNIILWKLQIFFWKEGGEATFDFDDAPWEEVGLKKKYENQA